MNAGEQVVGRKYPPKRVRLTRAGVRAYAAATDDGNPRYCGDEPWAPPMSIVMLTVPYGAFQVLSDEEVVPHRQMLDHMVHVEEELRWLLPVASERELIVQASVESVSDRGPGRLLGTCVSVYDAATNQLIAEARSRLFFRDPEAKGLLRGERRPDPEGPEVFRRTWRVADDQALRYAEASGDRNPIHIDPEAAREAGFGGVILHGLCTLAFVQRTVIDIAADGDPHRLRSLRGRFSKPVYVGDELTCSAHRVEHGPHGERLAIEVRNQRGRVVVQGGSASVAAPGHTLLSAQSPLA